MSQSRSAPTLKFFKSCSLCRANWADRTCFLADASVTLKGYQAHPTEPEKGLLVFQHDATGCGTSLAMPVSLFSDLYQGPRIRTLAYGSDDCEKRCLSNDDLEPCKANCSAAYVRELLRTIRSRQTA
ncbi:MAG: hypothetical protein A2X94_08650 [Bdellovibrionales bacterium GWB1_55_8]|nr:MAG: hypothetical protein A2X94_08650 [Bdellovibrionales bacterium GWB1_55_8]